MTDLLSGRFVLTIRHLRSVSHDGSYGGRETRGVGSLRLRRSPGLRHGTFRGGVVGEDGVWRESVGVDMEAPTEEQDPQDLRRRQTSVKDKVSIFLVDSTKREKNRFGGGRRPVLGSSRLSLVGSEGPVGVSRDF